MLYRKIPKTGDELSILGFGCMRLPLKDGRIDEGRATRQIRHAIDKGVNYLDTAWPYHGGESEPFLARALPGSLDKEELKLVAEASQKYKELMKVGCTGCGYCLPCPEGVAIPNCFEVYNKCHLFGNGEEAKIMYAMRMSGILTDGDASYASLCTQCGECLEKCPQHLEIPDFLSQVTDELEGPDLKEREAVAKKMLNIP